MKRAGKRRKKRTGKANAIGSRIKRVDSSMREIGTRRITKGPLVIGTTRAISPTRSGLAALGRTLASVQRASKKPMQKAKPGVYTFELQLRYRGPDGRFRTKDIPPAGFPLPNALKAWKKRYPKGHGATYRRIKDTKRTMTDEEAFRDLTESQIIGAVDRTIESEKDIFGNTEELLAKMKGKSKAEVRKAMKDFKERRGLTFKVTVRREL